MVSGKFTQSNCTQCHYTQLASPFYPMPNLFYHIFLNLPERLFSITISKGRGHVLADQGS